jgi:hypothetical protein
MKCSKRLLWAVLLVLGFVVMAGGCGGGGGGGGDSGYTSGDSSGTPENSGSASEISFGDLPGTWAATSGSGTVNVNGRTYNISLVRGSISFESVNPGTGDATAYVTYGFDWDVSIGNETELVRTFNNGEMVTVRRTGVNKLEYTFNSGDRISITATSNSTAAVTEIGTYWEGSEGFPYRATYYLNKGASVPGQSRILCKPLEGMK